MILVEYYPGYDIGYDATKMYVDISSIRYITHTTVGGHKYFVIGINGTSFTLTDESGKDLLCRMGLVEGWLDQMKWHKMQDFPYEATAVIDPNKFVIISQRFYSNRSPYNCFVAQLCPSDIKDGNCWRTPIGIYIDTDDTDRWAYIELTED